jgi:hypothetical protein
MDQLCVSVDGTSCASSKGKALAQELSRTLREAHHAWLLALNTDGPGIDAAKHAITYQQALSIHQFYVQQWLEPAVSGYLDQLSSLRRHGSQDWGK